jgi:hypothetical protein
MSEPIEPSPKSAARKPIAEWIFAAMVALLEMLNIIVSPGYIRPFAATPIGLVFLILFFAWQAVGLASICIPQSPVLKWPAAARWSIVPLFCVLPVFILLILGPAILTIFNALGPIESK